MVCTGMQSMKHLELRVFGSAIEVVLYGRQEFPSVGTNLLEKRLSKGNIEKTSTINSPLPSVLVVFHLNPFRGTLFLLLFVSL